jgi:drug/metabolite transporter (DMT)-like permease
MVIAMILSAAIGKLVNQNAKVLLPGAELRRSFGLFALEAFGGSYLFFYGFSHSSLAVAAALSSLAPVIAVPIAWVLKSEKFSLTKTFGIAAVALGISLLVGAGDFL